MGRSRCRSWPRQRSIAVHASLWAGLCFVRSPAVNGLTAGGHLAPKGCYIHPSFSIVNLSETERGIEVTGQSGIAPNEVLLSVPLEHIITPIHGRQTPAGKALQQQHQTVNDETHLALWICHTDAVDHLAAATDDDDNELPQGPEEYRFQDTLPSPDSIQHVPLFWSDHDLSELDGSRVRTDILRARTQLGALYDTIVHAFAPFGRQTSFDTFLWATACVQSRAFFLREEYHETDDSVKRDIGLVPLADMLNHRSRSESTSCDWRVEQQQDGDDDSHPPAMVIRTSSTGLPDRNEAFISYGLYPNAHYLQIYGFALEANRRHDGASPDEARLFAIVTDKDGWPTFEAFDVTIGDKCKANSILSALRAHVATEDERSTMVQTDMKDIHSSVMDGNQMEHKFHLPCSQRNEHAAISRLQFSVEDALGRYDTTLDEDLQWLARKSTGSVKCTETGARSSLDHLAEGSNRRHAVMVRSGEKHVLRHWLHLCHACLTCLADVEEGVTTWQSYGRLLDATLGRTESIAPPLVV